jgi:2-succinyl-6-hydroxy-2,4-cyclohexadiene-1-carboxylate synthase
VLLHGFLGHAQSYRLVLSALGTEKHLGTLLCPSLSGHDGWRPMPGASPEFGSRPPIPSYPEEVSRLAAVIERSCPPPRILVGYSMGGRLALSLCIDHPELVCRLVLLSARRGLDTCEARRCRISEDEGWARLLEAQGLERFLDEWQAQPLLASQASLPPCVVADERAHRSRHDPQRLADALRQFGLGHMPSHDTAVRRLRLPVRLLVGGRDPRFVALGQQLEQELPEGRLSVVSGAGHNLLLESPLEVKTAITEALSV